MTEFDLSAGQKAFLTGCWLGAAFFSAAVLLFDAARSLARKATR